MIKSLNTQTSKLKILRMYVLLGAIAFVMLFPLLWIFSTSFKSPAENIFQFPPQLFPSQPTLQNFITVWQSNPFGQYLFNSSIVAVLTVSLNLLFCSLAAYPLARMDFQGRDVIFTSIVSTIMIPFQIVMIPFISSSENSCTDSGLKNLPGIGTGIDSKWFMVQRRENFSPLNYERSH